METNYADFLRSGFWGDVRYRKLELNPRCQRCNSTRDLQVHHKFYRKSWYDTEIEDLETLCHDCHKKEHGIKSSCNSVGEAKKIKRKLWNINRKIKSDRAKMNSQPTRIVNPRDGNFNMVKGRLIYAPR